jgi:hypothetical protein
MKLADVSRHEYEQQRRRLNAQVGLVVFVLLPVPAILIAVGFSPLRMLTVEREYCDYFIVLSTREMSARASCLNAPCSSEAAALSTTR